MNDSITLPGVVQILGQGSVACDERCYDCVEVCDHGDDNPSDS